MITNEQLKYSVLVSNFFSDSCLSFLKKIKENKELTENDLSIFLWCRKARVCDVNVTEEDVMWLADEVMYATIEFILKRIEKSTLESYVVYFLTVEECFRKKIKLDNLQEFAKISTKAQSYLYKCFNNE
jgi:hypothetical protein